MNQFVDRHLIEFLQRQTDTFGCHGCGEDLATVLITPEHRIASTGKDAPLRPELRSALEKFFHPLITARQFGYVIFGSKPMALSPVVSDRTAELIKGGLPRPTESTYTAWNYYSDGRQNKLTMHLYQNSGPDIAQDLIIFDPKKVERVVETHPELFAHLTGRRISGLEMCDRLTQTPSLDEAFKSRDNQPHLYLRGLLHGFSLDSCLKFKSYQAKHGNYFSTSVWCAKGFIQPTTFITHSGDLEAKPITEKFERERIHIAEVMNSARWLDNVLAAI